MTTFPVPDRDEVIAARHYSQMLVEASKRGEVPFTRAREACQRYIDLAYARQRAVFGRIKCRISLSALLR